MKEHRDLATFESFHGEIDVTRVARCRCHRIRPRCRIAVGCGQPYDVVLTREVNGRRRKGQAECLGCRGLWPDVGDRGDLPWVPGR